MSTFEDGGCHVVGNEIGNGNVISVIRLMYGSTDSDVDDNNA
jgi:hypothetical protein